MVLRAHPSIQERVAVVCAPLGMSAQIATLLQDALGSDYRLEQELAAGGMSRLFLATDVRLGRRVVVKVLAPDLVSPTSVARFKREIDLTVRLQHPHILPILRSGDWDEGLFYITPFIEGESLRQRLDRVGKLPFDDILRILNDVAEALAFAHERSIVHRDVKPGNVLLAESNAVLADFGIARAVSTTATPLTGSGITPGTPAYMAPEMPTDERADIYSLGIVAYEMLCGALPPRGVTAKEIVTARGSVEGDMRWRLNRLATLVAASIAARPEARLASVKQFRDRLSLVTPATRPVRKPVLFAVASLAVLALTAFAWSRWRQPPLNPNRYVVLPLGSTDSLKSELVRATNDALSEWQGVSGIDATTTNDHVRDSAPRPSAVQELWGVARSLGARNLVVVDGRRLGDTLEVRATLYSGTSDSATRVSRAAYAASANPEDRVMPFRRLVNGILRDGAELPWRSASDRSRPQIFAWRAYDAGRAWLRAWRLAAAESSFRVAASGVPTVLPSHLWLAQTLMWEPPDSRKMQDVRSSARRLLDADPPMKGLDSLHAFALFAMADGRYPDACRAFRQMTALDGSDVRGWLGLGDCQAQDKAVVPFNKEGGGWRFRSSFEGAASAYQRARDVGATTLGPEFQGWLLGRLSRVLYTTTNKVRLGVGPLPDTADFAALPYLDHDTLSFTPLAMTELSSGAGPAFSTIQTAVTRNRNRLRQAAETWVRRAPDNPAAYDSLAAWTEVSGGTALVGERQVTTLDVLRRAILLSRDSVARLRLAVAETRALIKGGDFEAARAEADSLLRAGAAAHNSDVEGIPGLAALLGRATETARLMPMAKSDRRLTLPGGTLITPSPQLAAASSQLLAYASFPVVDSVAPFAHRAMDLARSYYADSNEARRVQSALVMEPLTFAYPAAADLMAKIGISGDDNARAYAVLASGDRSGAQAQLARLRQLARRTASGTAVENNLRRARLSLALFDTAGAIEELDPVLRALPTLGPSLLDRVPQVVGLVRAFALRAELAENMSDHKTAAECARAVVALWRDADPALQPVVARMKRLARLKP